MSRMSERSPVYQANWDRLGALFGDGDLGQPAVLFCGLAPWQNRPIRSILCPVIGDVEATDGAMDPGLIALLSGPPGAGKSTIARRLAEGFDRSAHLKVDDLREIMVNGFEPPGAKWTPANEEQFVRARAAATLIALRGARAGRSSTGWSWTHPTRWRMKPPTRSASRSRAHNPN